MCTIPQKQIKVQTKYDILYIIFFLTLFVYFTGIVDLMTVMVLGLTSNTRSITFSTIRNSYLNYDLSLLQSSQTQHYCKLTWDQILYVNLNFSYSKILISLSSTGDFQVLILFVFL